ncbi:lysine N(6)-hydroxylase/L-ornithine N(5)-oxygenase family protein [Rhizobium laguerreae]|uniref:Lysine N(6)-hydroxylase/L-ornithine N(5)-oxygenase family protein n=1 Tax=Rhizobium laguerreae TaxID=1076926 RepID=A0A1S9GB45_9HYPH|nr:SidA/IucD/PvdA family monooxygenase [Rhizobium laguerreae]MBB3163019.1 lysine N6-hydroxylase [Rhizobium laguerreae]MBY3064322.1 lysine N(6)-hydroxylase/L-ornithine N(5)-oxygenase family protein [Rhizobium laguerreae]MBY3257299.1 lysine N(6)-hydroxylase/L-ornithine N(5)-oxygenase family protein [Rhizobium laguerreae]MBY3278082.1 lysine N(6)-hydroxylase/L-ornithine N(5)-oxygenase family protein [Rhizobium laguerreae]MBY3284646.1 lysine N(6)-hydroxylase/L-ornithine N(5)-oxygenase family protei
MTVAFARRDAVSEPLDIAGIGIGPSNLSLACLFESVPEIRSCFFERRPCFDWHPGMMMPGVELQSSFLKDLVTPVLPTSRWSFVSYLVAHKRLYAFLNANYDAVPRQEFARYLAWVANGVDGLRFGTEIRDVEHRDDRFFLRFDNGQEEARNLVIGTGSSPFVPDWAKPFLSADCFHNSEAKSRLSDLGAARIVVVGGGQSGGEVVEALLADPGSMTELTWISRRHNFEPINDTPFSNQVFSPEYVQAYLKLSGEQKQAALRNSILTSDGLSISTIHSIYRRLYALRYLEPSTLNASLAPNRDVIQMERNGNAYRLIVRNQFDGGIEVLHADAVVLATGYRFRLPDALGSLGDRIALDRNGYPLLNDDYTMQWTGPRANRLFAQNAGRYSHGIADSQLSLMAWRSATIVNTLLGRQHFDAEPDNGQLAWATEIASAMPHQLRTGYSDGMLSS